MRHTKTNSKMTAVAAVLLLAIGKAAAQENPERRMSDARIVVSIPDCKLAVIENGKVVKVYSTAVGAPVSPSPVGTFQVVSRIPHPTYYHPGKVIGPGKANPLGTHWLGLSVKGFGIHGTNAPRSIGRAASHGCVRMRNSDIAELFGMVKVGDVVELHGERDETVSRIFGTATMASAAVAALPGAAQ